MPMIQSVCAEFVICRWLSNLTGRGSCFMFDEGRALVCQQNGNDSLRVYAGVRQPETWVRDCGRDWNSQISPGRRVRSVTLATATTT